MIIDFSVFKNIDFTNIDNLLFLSIFLIIAIIVFLIFVVIVFEITKTTKKTIVRIFNTGIKKPKFNKGESADWMYHPQETKEIKEVGNVPKPKVTGGDFTRSFNTGEKKPEEKQKDTLKTFKEKEEKDIAEGLSSLKSGSSAGGGTLESKMPSRTGEQGKNNEEIKIPKPKVTGGDFTRSFNTGEKKPEEKQKDTLKTFKEKEEKDIAEGLSSLKSGSSAGGGTLESKMPSRTGEQGKNNEEINIPTSSSLHGQPLVYEKKKIEAAKITLQKQNKGLEESPFVGKESNVNLTVAGKSSPSHQTKQDNSIFGGKSEISRTNLRQKLRSDQGVYKAEKAVGLNMSPLERAKLEKQVFSQTLGRNISKTDLKSGIRKLNQRLSDVKDSAEHTKIRKEIKFFKKIGGIK